MNEAVDLRRVWRRRKHRADDTPEAIDRRLDLYEAQTSPLIDHYSRSACWPWSTVSATPTTCSSALRRGRSPSLMLGFFYLYHKTDWTAGAPLWRS